jgi:hypothetical protein
VTLDVQQGPDTVEMVSADADADADGGAEDHGVEPIDTELVLEYRVELDYGVMPEDL